MQCPCKRECPDRSVTCRVECLAYLEYAAFKTREYEENAARFNARGSNPAEKRRARNLEKLKREGRK